MSIRKFKIRNVSILPFGLSDAVGLSELVLDAHTKISTERRFFRQERIHPEHGHQRLDYYLEGQTVYIECLDTISFLNILETTGLNFSVASAIQPAIIEDARRQLAEEEKIREKELSDFWKVDQRAGGL